MWVSLVNAGPDNSSQTREKQGQVKTNVQGDHPTESRMGPSWKEKGATQHEGTGGPDNSSLIQEQQGPPLESPQGDQIIPPKAGISWKEKVMMQREIQKRAAASRNALMREAAMNNQEKTPKTILISPVKP
jgi:hypothetical protein